MFTCSTFDCDYPQLAIQWNMELLVAGRRNDGAVDDKVSMLGK